MTSRDIVLKIMVSKFFGDNQTLTVIDSPFSFLSSLNI